MIHSWAFQQSSLGSLGHLSPNCSLSIGLDHSLLQTFPTFVYSSVKDFHKKKYGLECAICLLEFEDNSIIRLLIVCCHVFHQECIDLWLRSHKTCPICRIDLDSSSIQMRKSGDNCNHNHNHAEGQRESGGDIRIDIREGEVSDRGGEYARGDNKCDKHRDSLQQQQEHKFARSCSTGHSIVRIKGKRDEEKEDDKYMLRLPKLIIRGRHHCSKSYTSYQEMQMTGHCSNCGFIEFVSGCSSSPSHAQKT